MVDLSFGFEAVEVVGLEFVDVEEFVVEEVVDVKTRVVEDTFGVLQNPLRFRFPK